MDSYDLDVLLDELFANKDDDIIFNKVLYNLRIFDFYNNLVLYSYSSFNFFNFLVKYIFVFFKYRFKFDVAIITRFRRF